MFGCHNPTRVKLATKLDLRISNLREHKFKHSFQDFLNLVFTCDRDVLYYPTKTDKRTQNSLEDYENVGHKLLDQTDWIVTLILHSGDNYFDTDSNTVMLNVDIILILIPIP